MIGFMSNNYLRVSISYYRKDDTAYGDVIFSVATPQTSTNPG